MRTSIKSLISVTISRFELLTINWLMRIVAVILITLGIITFPLPLPFGLILIIIGLAMLIPSSKTLSVFIKKQRNKYSEQNKSLEKFKRFVPDTIRRVLEKTDPE